VDGDTDPHRGAGRQVRASHFDGARPGLLNITPQAMHFEVISEAATAM